MKPTAVRPPSSPASRRHPGAIVAPALRVATLFAVLLAAPAAPAAARPDQVGKLTARADQSYEKHDYRRAAELYAKADAAAGGRSLAAVVGLTRSSLYLLRFDDAIAAAERWIRMAGTPRARAAGYQHLGFSLHRRGLTERWEAARPPSRKGSSGSPVVGETSSAGEASLRAAVDAFHRAAEQLAEDDEDRRFVLLNLADTLSWLGEFAEARSTLDAYAAAGGTDPYAEEIGCWVGRRVGRDEGEGRVAGDDVEPLTLDVEEVQAPVKIYAPPPRYPLGARAARMEGEIILLAILTKEGTIACVRPVRGVPYPLAEAAMAAVKNWRFKPALLRGQPVDVYYNLTVNFALRQ